MDMEFMKKMLGSSMAEDESFLVSPEMLRGSAAKFQYKVFKPGDLVTQIKESEYCRHPVHGTPAIVIEQESAEHAKSRRDQDGTQQAVYSTLKCDTTIGLFIEKDKFGVADVPSACFELYHPEA